VNPTHVFTEDYEALVKVQVDHCRLRWADEDIMLVTNFPYEFKGLKAIQVPDELFCEHRKRASKINVICYLIEQGILAEPAWFHDFDAYQEADFPDVLGSKEAAFTDYGFNEMWNTGSFFFQPSFLDAFKLIRKTMNRRRINEEQALKRITDANVDNVNDRYVKLNNTYNLGRMRMNELTYAKAEKPIKVFHFHPRMTELYENVKPLLSSELINTMKRYGY
jgi:hypothetical protein